MFLSTGYGLTRYRSNFRRATLAATSNRKLRFALDWGKLGYSPFQWHVSKPTQLPLS